MQEDQFADNYPLPNPLRTLKRIIIYISSRYNKVRFTNIFFFFFPFAFLSCQFILSIFLYICVFVIFIFTIFFICHFFTFKGLFLFRKLSRRSNYRHRYHHYYHNNICNRFGKLLEDTLTIAINWKRTTRARRVKTRESVTLTIFIYRGGTGSTRAPSNILEPGHVASHPTPFHPATSRPAGPGRAGRCTSSPSKQFDISIIPHRYMGG